MRALPDTAMTVGAAVRDAARRLRRAGSPTPRLDAEVLLGHVIGRERAWLLAHPEATVAEAAAFDAVVRRRARGEPIAYIRRFKEWHSLRILADARALIPRPETELLADAAASAIEERLPGDPVVAWEVGTGSGAVVVALVARLRRSLEDGRLRLVATDVSADALDLAAANLDAHGVADLVTLERADLLAGAGTRLPRPDVVAANLPYVSSAEVDERRGSLGYEPRIALDGGPDGLVLLRRLLRELPDRAARRATALLELGIGQVEAIRSMTAGGASLSVVADLSGLDRIVRIDLS